MSEAFKAALSHNPDFIWLFDDDVLPYPHALETLTKEIRLLDRERPIGALRGMMVDPRTGATAGGGISQAGLLKRTVVEQVGLPEAGLFIELSDHHYNVRIRKAGFDIFRLPVVLSEHPVDTQKTLRQIVTEGYRVKPWRLYYAVRNRIYVNLYMHRSWGRTFRQVATAVGIILLLTLFGRPRRGQFLVIRGMVDGFLGRLGRRVAPGY
jgi:GT2 family glycosyltransferase